METQRPSLDRLVLVGTVHHDPEGFKKLNRFFSSYAPDLILVELSPFGWAFRKRHQHHWLRTLDLHLREAARRCDLPYRQALLHPQITAIRRQISLPFEYRAAERYGREHGLKPLLVDSSRLSRRWVASWQDLMAVENLVLLLRLPSEPASLRSLYASASRRIKGDDIVSLYDLREYNEEERELWETRESFMACKIRRFLEYFRPQRPVHVGGWWHLASGSRRTSLRDLLDIPLNRCRLLDEKIEK